MAPATVVAAAASIQVGHSTPGLSIHLPSQLLLLLTPYPPVDPAHQSPPAWTAGPARQRPVPASSCPPSAVNPVHAVAPRGASISSSSIPPSLPPNPSSTPHPSLPRRRAFAGLGEGRSSARVGGRALAGVASRRPSNLRRAARAPSPSPVRPAALGLPATQSCRCTGFDME
ncbi:hypothetical protein VPH35_103290 [Triticum aestivum]